MAAGTKDFAANLQAQLEAQDMLTPHEKKILKILKAPDSASRTKKLWRWENAARAVAGIDPKTGAVNWSTAIDWKKLLAQIIKLILESFLL